MPKDLHFDLPPGLVGNPHPLPQCPDELFLKHEGSGYAGGPANACPANTSLGAVSVELYEPLLGPGPQIVTVPAFNLKPSVGEHARFGFRAVVADVYLDTAVRTGGDYGVTVSVNNITQLAAF